MVFVIMRKVIVVVTLVLISSSPFLCAEENKAQTEQKAIRIGGFFGSYYEVKKEGDKLVYQKTSKPNNSMNDSQKAMKNSKIITEPKLKKVGIPQYWKPLEERDKNGTDKERPSFFVCPGCGTHISDKDKDRHSCPYCGFKLID